MEHKINSENPDGGENDVHSEANSAVADSRLTRFALAIYRADGVSTACLMLQERFELDVNLVLFAAFFGAQEGRALTPTHIGALTDRTDPWHAEVVRPLRAVRKRLKSGPVPAPNARTNELRKTLQGLEIEAELIELAELATVGETLEADPAAGEAATRATAAIEVVVGAKTNRALDSDERAAIARIANAAALVGDTARVM